MEAGELICCSKFRNVALTGLKLYKRLTKKILFVVFAIPVNFLSEGHGYARGMRLL
jgi:hypothetical protein